MLCVVYRYWYKKTACKEFPKYITEQKKDKKKMLGFVFPFDDKKRKKKL